MNEFWLAIENYNGIYEISSFGRVRSLPRYRSNGKAKYLQPLKILKPQIDGCGYYQVFLYKNGKSKKYKIHQLVATHFIINKNNYTVINHIDGNKLNNKIDNLEWCIYSYNNKHAYKKKLKVPCYKEIQQYDKNNNFIKLWNGSREIERNLKINNSNIIQCCKGKRKTAGNYIWKYKRGN